MLNHKWGLGSLSALDNAKSFYDSHLDPLLPGYLHLIAYFIYSECRVTPYSTNPSDFEPYVALTSSKMHSSV